MIGRCSGAPPMLKVSVHCRLSASQQASWSTLPIGRFGP
jgi:hypothetical protein